MGIKEWIAVAAFALTVLGGAASYGAVTARLAEVERRADLTDDVAALKVQLGHLDKQLDRIEGKLDRRNSGD